MMKAYIKVKCSDELPDRDSIYFVIDSNGAMFADRFVQGKWYSYPIHPVEYWLKEVTIPDEEEIENESIKYDPDDGVVSMAKRVGFYFGVNWLLSKLK